MQFTFCICLLRYICKEDNNKPFVVVKETFYVVINLILIPNTIEVKFDTYFYKL